MTVEFDQRYRTNFERDDNHLIVPVYMFHYNLGRTLAKVSTDFIFDTGAKMTLIPAATARAYNYDALPTLHTTRFGGIVPGMYMTVEYKRIPGVKLVGKYINQVVVAIPCNPEEPAYHTYSINILGQNVLEYFDYFMDTKNDQIYFLKNTDPKPINEYAACGNIFTADESAFNALHRANGEH